VSLAKINEYVVNLVEKGQIKKADLEKGVEINFKENPAFKKYGKVIGRAAPKYKLILKNVKTTEKVKELVESKGGKLE
jgi:ribosomal protein L15